MRAVVLVLAGAAGLCMALGVEEHAGFAVVQDSILYGGGMYFDASAGVRLFSGPWVMRLEQTYRKASGDGAALPRFSRNRSETTLNFGYIEGAFSVEPEFRFVTDLDSSTVVLPASEGVAERGSTLRPGLKLAWKAPGDVTLNAFGRYWNRGGAGFEDGELSWTETMAGGGAVWTSPLGVSLGIGGLAGNTAIDETGFDRGYSRVNVAASLTSGRAPAGTQLTADMVWSFQGGDDHNGNPLPDRATGRVRAVQTLARNLTFNFTVAQTLDFDDGTTRLAAFQAGARLRLAFRGWGDHPSSVGLYGQGTRSFVTTGFGELETRVGVYRGLSVLLGGKIWKGPSSIAGTGGSRRRETYGGGLEYRMKNGLSAWFVFRRQASELEYTETWNSIQGGVAFHPAAHLL